MKNIDLSTGEILEMDQPQAHETREEKKEPTNREAQFQRLVTASAAARELRELMTQNATTAEQAIFYQSQPLNYYILKYIYKEEGISGFKKFNDWKKEGATIKKGAKAYPIWGQPVARQKEEEAERKGGEYEPNAEDERRFPMCYVFSNLQVIFKAELQTVAP
ncbi:ssDNA-binding domain-containing protein [Bacteroidales bacterium OttesenSCG-928-B11]|nr:ssDNA-binding domain-containing protein [Bacteroidales bacterium OttesenSCG-928-B11]